MLIVLFIICCQKSIEPLDCNGASGGNAVEDNCGICDTDSSNDCVQDCNGEWGGNGIVDSNSSCCFHWEQDDCGICLGDNLFTDSFGFPCEEGSGGDCTLLDGGCDCIGNDLDQCGVCAGNGVPCLDVYINSELSFIMGDTINLILQVENADYLYSLSFKLEYNRDQYGVLLNDNEMFDHINEGTVTVSELFNEPFLPYSSAFNQDGEINVVMGEMGTVSPMISGSACIIKLIVIGTGSSYIEINDLHMIESDGASIEGLSTIAIEGLRITVSE